MLSTIENCLVRVNNSVCMGKVRVYKHKDSTRRLSDLMNSFSKVAGYDVNMKNPVTFLFISDQDAEKEIREKLLFTVASRQTPLLSWRMKEENTHSKECDELDTVLELP